MTDKTTLADRYGADVEKAGVGADIALVGAIKTALGADTAAEALAKLLTMNRDHGGVMVRWDGDSVSITPADTS